MFHKCKLLVFIVTIIIVVYGVSAVFYGKVVAKDEAYKEINVFMEVLNKIKDDYVEDPNMNNVQEGAMRGLISALDPYCSFMSKDQYDDLLKRKANGDADIGVVLSKRSDIVYVVACRHESPAEAAGVRPGDYLISVDGKEVEDKSILEVNGYLRGAPGSNVKITTVRSSKPKPMELTMSRTVLAAVPVSSKILEGRVGLLSVASLAGPAIEQAKIKLKTLISAGAAKIILDLRDCADGEPANGADLASFFLPEGIVYYSQNRQGEKVQVVAANPDMFITNLPMAVLIDSSTAGAAEIAAGALKDHKRAAVIGEKSFGIGSAQKVVQLKSGAVLILSTAKHCTPGGKVIQDELIRNAGILPNIQAPDDDKRQDFLVDAYYFDQDDLGKYRQLQEKIEKLQLDKALEILLKEPALIEKKAA